MKPPILVILLLTSAFAGTLPAQEKNFAALPAPDVSLEKISPQTADLYRAFLAQQDSPHRTEIDPAYKALFAAPDADLCFLHALADPHEGLRRMALRALWQLRSPRLKNCAFDILADKTSNPYARMSAIYLLGYNGGSPTPSNPATLLLNLLANDPDPRVRAAAARALGGRTDPVAAALLAAYKIEKDPAVKTAALIGLANGSNDACIAPALKLLRESNAWYDHADAISILTAYTWSFNRLPPGKLPPDPLLQAKAILRKSDLPCDNFLLERDSFLTEHGQFNDTPSTLPFTADPADLHLTATLDAETFRPNEPIQLRIRFENTSAKQAYIPLPILDRSIPLEGVAFEIKNLATGHLLKPPEREWGGGSYVHPVCQLLAPHQSVQQIRCLQHALTAGKWFPIPAGAYSLTFIADLTASARKTHDQDLITRWTSPPVIFTIKGDPLNDPQELVAAIAKKSGIPDIAADLQSHNTRRWQYAWWSLDQFAPDNLPPYLKQTYSDHYTNDGGIQPIQWDP